VSEDEEREETQAEREAGDTVARLVSEGRAKKSGCDPLLWELYLVWRARVYEYGCLTRGRLAAAFTPRGEQEQE
jgi:hypothetical protein